MITMAEKPAWQDSFILGYHDRVCSPSCRNREACSQRWASLLPADAVYQAAAYLGLHPRDAKGARLIVHDGVCMGSCDGEVRVDHANRTQSELTAALRKALAEVGHHDCSTPYRPRLSRSCRMTSGELLRTRPREEFVLIAAHTTMDAHPLEACTPEVGHARD